MNTECKKTSKESQVDSIVIGGCLFLKRTHAHYVNSIKLVVMTMHDTYSQKDNAHRRMWRRIKQKPIIQKY